MVRFYVALASLAVAEAGIFDHWMEPLKAKPKYDPVEMFGIAMDRARVADLGVAKEYFNKVAPATAASMHALSTLALISGDLTACVAHRRTAKTLDNTTLPPLAMLHKNGERCGGLGDVYWTAAFLAKKLQTLADGDPYCDGGTCDNTDWGEGAFEAHTQMAAILEDSGALAQAMAHVTAAALLKPGDGGLRFKTALMVPVVSATHDGAHQAHTALAERVPKLRGTRLDKLDQVSMPGTFYVVYLGGEDAALMTEIARAYALAYPPLQRNFVAKPSGAARDPAARIKVGFVSSYWKRHSVSKLLAGVVRGLSPRFDVTVFDASDATDEWTAYALETGATHARLEKGLVLSERSRAAGQDVLVYADLGMETRATTWAHGRLAPVQAVFWGHPHTSGLPDTIDYFITSDGYEPRNCGRSKTYAEQAVRFDSPGFYFRHPEDAGYARSLAEIDARVLGLKAEYGLAAHDGIYLVPQSIPKFHPDFDEILVRLAFSTTRKHAGSEVVVITYDPSKLLWMNQLKRRLEHQIAKYSAKPSVILAKIKFVPMARGDDYFALLRAATLLLDPFPFGGGVTTLEAFAMCRAVVTAPRLQSVVSLARGMRGRPRLVIFFIYRPTPRGSLFRYRTMNMTAADAPIARDAAEAVKLATALSDDAGRRTELEARICETRADPGRSLFSNSNAVDEWAAFLTKAAAPHH